MNYIENIGKNIKNLRTAKGITQEALAEMLGLSYQAVSKWETGANSPDIAMLPKLAEIFGTSIDSLFREGTTSPVAPELRDSDIIKDDDIIRIVQMRGGKIIKVHPDRAAIEIDFPKNCNNLTQYFKVEVYGNVCADGSVNGDVVCHGALECHDINGDVKESEAIDCGNINGNVSAESVDCGDITGNVGAKSVKCRDITGNVGSKSIEAENITTTADITCESITGCGTIICKALNCTGTLDAEAVIKKE